MVCPDPAKVTGSGFNIGRIKHSTGEQTMGQQQVSRWIEWLDLRLRRPSVPIQAPVAGAALIKGVAGRGLEMFILPGDLISDALAAHGVWEPLLTQRLLEAAQAGGLLVEVGANLGYFALLWAAVQPANRVIALEPAPRNLALFQANVARNGLDRQISVLPVAAGPRVALVPFDLGPPAQTGWGGVVADPAQASAPTQVVTVPLDDLLAEVGEIAVLKIDVEGFDTQVLAGCRRLLCEQRVRMIYYEQNHPRMAALGVDPQEAQRLLTELGYRAEPLASDCPEVVEWMAQPAVPAP